MHRTRKLPDGLIDGDGGGGGRMDGEKKRRQCMGLLDYSCLSTIQYNTANETHDTQ